MHDVVLHTFNWRYTDIANEARNIADAGYGAVLMPPLLYSDEQGSDWWQRYQPKDYRVIRSYLGRKHDVERAVRALHFAGVRAYADLVFNRMANEKRQRPDPFDFPGEAQLARYRAHRGEFESDRLYGNLDFPLFRPSDFYPLGDIADYNRDDESRQKSLEALPDLDLNDWVAEQQHQCLRALNDLGFDGYRIEAMKHAPVDHIRRVFQTDEMTGKFAASDTLSWKELGDSSFIWPIVNSTPFMAYDFILHDTLRKALTPDGSMKSLIDPHAYGQALAWWQAVTFAVTHDIPNNARLRNLLFDPQDEYLAYAYILGRDGGVPLVYSDHNESADRFPDDKDRWHGAWKRYDMVQMLKFHNSVQGMMMRPLVEDDGFIVFARGDCGIVALNKTTEKQTASLPTAGLRRGRYHCQLHQVDLNLIDETLSLEIPPRQAQLWLHVGL
jgi:alpha-amylase